MSDAFALFLERVCGNAVNSSECDLQYNGIGDRGVDVLLDKLLNVAADANNNTVLRRLDLTHNDITWRGATALASFLGDVTHAPKLKMLILNDNPIRASGAAALAAAFGGDGDGVRQRRSMALTRLYLDCCDIGDDGATELAQALAAAGSGIAAVLTTLCLSQNYIGDLGAAALAAPLGANTTVLLALDLNSNHIKEGGIFFLFLVLLCGTAQAVQTNNRGADGAVALAAALGKNTQLRWLNLLSNKIDADGAASLAEGLQSNMTLKTLILSKNHVFVGDDSRRTISALTSANVRVAAIFDEYTPPLSDGSGDCGAFDALPNEALSVIAELVWPTAEAAFPLAHTCRRWRDVVLSDFVATHRCGVTPDANSGGVLLPRRDVRWVYRAAAVERWVYRVAAAAAAEEEEQDQY